MQDRLGRKITYLRISVTDRCDFRCLYCMPDGASLSPKKDVLRLEELEQIAKAFIDLGVDKIRITGGEPLLRHGIMDLFEGLSRHLGDGLKELTLTTNGGHLADAADRLVELGVKRVNVSLDTLDPETFKRITGRDRLTDVLRGIRKATSSGLKVKINTLALKGINDNELNAFVAWCAGEGYDLTFIEAMPIGQTGRDHQAIHLPMDQLHERLGAVWTLIPEARNTGGPARYFRVNGNLGRVGFISPLSHGFCGDCNRVRLTCTGRLYPCLGIDDWHDLRQPLRDGGIDVLTRAIGRALDQKPDGHRFTAAPGGRIEALPDRPMSRTGG